MNRICPWTSRFLHTRYFSITIYIRSPEIFEFYSTSHLRVLNNGKKKEEKRKKEKGKRKSNRRWTDSAIFPLSPICKVQCLLVATPPGYLNYSWKWKRYFSRGGMQLRRGGRSFLKGNLIFFFFWGGANCHSMPPRLNVTLPKTLSFKDLLTSRGKLNFVGWTERMWHFRNLVDLVGEKMAMNWKIIAEEICVE